MIELKPCPFCGGEAEMRNIFDNYYVEHECFCNDLNAIRIRTYFRPTPEQAAELWNTREVVKE